MVDIVWHFVNRWDECTLCGISLHENRVARTRRNERVTCKRCIKSLASRSFYKQSEHGD